MKPNKLNLNLNLKFWNLHLLRGNKIMGVFCPYAIVYCYHEFKLRYLKNQKLFSIRVKELFESIVLEKKKKKKKAMGFCSF